MWLLFYSQKLQENTQNAVRQKKRGDAPLQATINGEVPVPTISRTLKKTLMPTEASGTISVQIWIQLTTFSPLDDKNQKQNSIAAFKHAHGSNI